MTVAPPAVLLLGAGGAESWGFFSSSFQGNNVPSHTWRLTVPHDVMGVVAGVGAQARTAGSMDTS